MLLGLSLPLLGVPAWSSMLGTPGHALGLTHGTHGIWGTKAVGDVAYSQLSVCCVASP
jgi:hypothetical protein